MVVKYQNRLNDYMSTNCALYNMLHRLVTMFISQFFVGALLWNLQIQPVHVRLVLSQIYRNISADNSPTHVEYALSNQISADVIGSSFCARVFQRQTIRTYFVNTQNPS
jgi:hypothetical protein